MRPIRFTVRWLALLALPAMLSACAAYDPDRRYVTFAGFQQEAPRPQVQVAEVPVRHAVAFAPDAAALTEVEREALHMFLARTEVKAGAHVTLAAAGPASLADARLRAVREELARLGVRAAGARLGEVEPRLDEIVVTTQIATVVQPDCPGYNAPIVFDFENRPLVNLGCVNAINLGHMVVDPRELAYGKPLEPADGEATTLSIQRYRAGAVVAIEEEVTTQ